MGVYTWLVSFAAGMGGLLFGYEIGVIGQVLAMNSFNYYFNMEYPVTNDDGTVTPTDTGNLDNYTSLITGMFLIGCFFGACAFIFIIDGFSRKYSIIVGGLLFAIGGAFQAASNGLALLLVGRLISGFAIGTVSMVVPVYLAETAPTSARGSITTVYQLMITIGIFVATCVNSIIIKTVDESTDTNWRVGLGIQIAPSLLLVLLVFFIPFSPRWLAEKNRHDDGIAALAKLREKPTTDPEVISEYAAIREHVEFERSIGQASWSEFQQPGLRRRLILGIVNQFFQQFTGINVILYYGPTLFKYMGFASADTVIAFPLANTFINFIATFPGMFMVDRFGRRNLLLYGGMVEAVAHAFIYIFVTIGNTRDAQASWGAIIAVYVFTVAFASTWGPVVWSYQAEIFPLRLRAKGAGISTMSNWAWNAVIAFAWPKVFTALDHQPVAYWIWAAFCTLSAIWVFFAVPETKGKSLEEIDDVFGDNVGASSAGNLEVGAEKK